MENYTAKGQYLTSANSAVRRATARSSSTSPAASPSLASCCSTRPAQGALGPDQWETAPWTGSPAANSTATRVVSAPPPTMPPSRDPRLRAARPLRPPLLLSTPPLDGHGFMVGFPRVEGTQQSRPDKPHQRTPPASSSCEIKNPAVSKNNSGSKQTKRTAIKIGLPPATAHVECQLQQRGWRL